MIGGLVWQDLSEPVRGLLAKRYEEHQELREILPKPNRFGIVTTIERLRRSAFLRQERRQRLNARRRRKRTRAEALAKVWRAFDADGSTAWVGFCDGAYQTEDTDSLTAESIDRSDITSSPAWKTLDPAQSEKLRVAARRFLTKHRDSHRRTDQWSNFASAACYAIALFRHEIESDADLRLVITERWPMIIFDGLAQNEAVAAVYRVLPSGGQHGWPVRCATKISVADISSASIDTPRAGIHD